MLRDGFDGLHVHVLQNGAIAPELAYEVQWNGVERILVLFASPRQIYTLYRRIPEINAIRQELEIEQIKVFNGGGKEIFLPFLKPLRPRRKPPLTVLSDMKTLLQSTELQDIKNSHRSCFIVKQQTGDVIDCSEGVIQTAGMSRLELLAKAPNMRQVLTRESYFELFERDLMRQGTLFDAVYSGSVSENWGYVNGVFQQLTEKDTPDGGYICTKRIPQSFRARTIKLIEFCGILIRVTEGVERVG